MPILRVIYQRAYGDCGVASLAMISGTSWEEAAAAFGRPDPKQWARGCLPYEIIAAGASLGLQLERKLVGTFDPDTSIGIVNIGSNRGWHVAVLYRGLLFDTDGHVWTVPAYLAAYARHEPWLGMLLALV